PPRLGKLGKSGPVALDHADFSPASGASLIALEFPATRRSLRPLPPDSRKAAGKCAGMHEAPGRNCGLRPAPGAKSESSAVPADALSASPEHREPRPTSCPLFANARAAR